MEKKYTDAKIEVVEVEDVIVTSIMSDSETPIQTPGDRRPQTNSDWQ